MKYEISIVPRSERETLIAQRVENSDKTGSPVYEFRGGYYTPKVISLGINVPVYRMGNCRVFSAQQSAIAKQGLERDHFAKGQEKSSVQTEQHSLLAKLAERKTTNVASIVEVLSRDGQREPILITSTGVVVNGNRRLAAMRELYRRDDGSVDNRFSHVECSVLPPDTTADEIDDIEADLQARPETKLEYDWVGDAQLVRRQINKGRTPKEVGDRLRRSEADIKNVLQSLEEADLYLNEWIGKPGQYDLVSGDGEQIFGDIPKKIARKDPGLQNASRVIAWSLYENREQVPGRVYSYNAAFGELAPQVLDILSDQLDLDVAKEDEFESEDEDFLVDIEEDNGANDYVPLIDALKNEESKEEAVVALIDACQTALEREKGKKSEKAALKALSQVNAKLTGIDVLSAGEQTLPGMKKQIESIQSILNKMNEAIDKRMTGIESESK